MIAKDGLICPEVPVISIIDDDASVRAAANRLVRSLGYIAHPFASAREFLESSQVNDTSCLIADVQMPGMSGLELQSQLACPRARAADHFHHRLPRRQRPQAGVGCRRDLLSDQAVRRTDTYQIPGQGSGAGWREIARDFLAVLRRYNGHIRHSANPALNQSIAPSNQFDAGANLRRMEHFVSVDLP